MMSLAKVSVHMGRHYYKTENYYANDRCIKNSEWFGVGAAELGLSGHVDTSQFQKLLEGHSPTRGEALNKVKNATSQTRRAGLDLTFSAPKSVSLAALVGGDERLIQAHNAAVDAALGVFEKRYSLTRTGGQTDRRCEVTGKIVAAKFLHDTSRAKDPQLHTHCVVINAVRRKDGAWRSLHNEAVYQNSKLLGLIYQNELADRVLRLGYEIKKSSLGMFEIDGYSTEQLRKFSKRRTKILDLGAENQRDARMLVKVGRQSKGQEIPRSVLAERWAVEARECNIEHPLPRSSQSQGKHQTLEQETQLNVPLEEVVAAGVRHATEHDVSFRREDVERFVLESNLGAVSWQQLQGELRTAKLSGLVIAHSESGLTTGAGLQTESSILEAIKQGSERFVPLQASLPENIKSNTLGLSQGQWDAVSLTLQSKDQFIAWQGVAGAGKTFAINVIREIADSQGVRILGFAPSAEAAKVLETESHVKSSTVAALLTQRQEAKVDSGALWVVDEAGLLSARDCLALVKRAQQQSARVVFVGDTRQLSSVGAGNPFKLMQGHGIATAFLSESRRQKTEELKSAVRLISEGKVEAGLGAIDRKIVELRRESTRIDHVTTAYCAMTPEERAQTLILAGTNRERDALTERIRSRLCDHGHLGKSVSLMTLRPRDLTSEQSKNSINIVGGDVLVFHRSFRLQKIEKGTPYEVIESSGKQVLVKDSSGRKLTVNPDKQSAFVIYEKRQSEFAVGDRVRWTRNDKERGVRNGQDAVVLDVSQSTLTLKNSDGKVVKIDSCKLEHLDHNYVNTVFSSQGKTCQKVLVSTDKSFGREAIYVAISRAKCDVQIFTEDKAILLKNALRSHAKRSVFELLSDEMRRKAVATTEQVKIPLSQESKFAQTKNQSRRH